MQILANKVLGVYFTSLNKDYLKFFFNYPE